MQYTPDDEPADQRIDDGEYDRDAIKEGDERAKGQTWFNPDDAEIGVHMSNGPNQNKWEWLRDLNDGSHSSERKEELRVASRVIDAEFVAEECSLGDNEQETIKRLVKTMDFRFGPYVRTEDVVLGIIYYVGTTTKKSFNEQKLNEFAEQWDVESDMIHNLKSSIESKISQMSKNGR